MTPRSRRPGRWSLRRPDDAGIAVVAVVLLSAVLTALLVTSSVVTVNNLGNARQDRQSLSALSTSEAGLAQAVQYLRGTNLGSLTCTEPLFGSVPGASCQGAGPSWISAVSPKEVSLDGATGACATSSNCFKVWIGTVQPYVANCAGRHAAPPTPCYGVYRVHATGLAGSGPGARRLAADVKVTPYPLPIGIFASTFAGHGNVGIHYESLFTSGCVVNRQDDSRNGSGFQFAWDSANNRPVIDLIYDQPTAAHAADNPVSTSNNSCASQHIHAAGACNSTFKYDQDGDGAALTPGDGCYGAYTRADGSVYPTTSNFVAADLERYGYRPRGLTDAVYDSLRAQAQAQGTYNLATGAVSARLSSLTASGVASPVLYWDNGDVDLHLSDLPGSFARALSSSTNCASNSLTIVVAGPGNDLTFHGGNNSPYMVASMFVPDGTLTGQGGFNVIGTVFAQTVDLGGNPDFYMDQCFASNPPGGILDAQATNWREDDSTDFN